MTYASLLPRHLFFLVGGEGKKRAWYKEGHVMHEEGHVMLEEGHVMHGEGHVMLGEGHVMTRKDCTSM